VAVYTSEELRDTVGEGVEFGTVAEVDRVRRAPCSSEPDPSR